MYDFLYFTFFPSLYLKMVVKLKMNAYLLHLIKGSLKKNTLISRSLVFLISYITRSQSVSAWCICPPNELQ